MGRTVLIGVFVLSALLFFAGAGICQEQKTDTEALIRLLQQKGIISEKEAREFLQRSGGEAGAKTSETESLEEEVKRLREELNSATETTMQRQRLSDRKVEDIQNRLSDINSKVFKSDWAQRIRFGGDIRLRYQGDYFDNNNALFLDPNDPDKLLNTREDRERFRYRARLAVLASLTDPTRTNPGKVDVGLRITTGNEKDPVSTNDTFGDYKNKDGIVLDQAFLRYNWKPTDALIFDWIPQFTLIGGRIPNPFFYTDLVWDHDLGFEGFAFSLLTDTQEEARLRGFFSAGAFPVQEVEFSSDDKWLYGIQAGIEAKPFHDLQSKIGLAYYDYRNIVGRLSPPSDPTRYDYTAPLFLQKGNTLFDIDPGAGIRPALASDYELINVTAQFDYARWHPVHVILTGDYVKNIGFDKQQARRNTGSDDVDDATQGFSAGMQVGYPNIVNFAEWNVLLVYKYLEADAVLDAFTDSDFHGGGTNAKGWVIGAGFGLYHNVWMNLRWLTADEIDGPPLSIDVLQVDVNARF